MIKLTENERKLMGKIIEENNSIIELDNKRYYLSAIEIHEPNGNNNDSDNTAKTKQLFNERKLNLLNEGKFSIDDVVEMIDHGVL